MEPQKYDVMRFVKENDEKLQRHYEKMKELEQRERELNFQQMYKKYSNQPDDYKSSNTFPQNDISSQNEQLQYQIRTEPQRNNNQYVYEMNTYKNGMFNPLAPSYYDNVNELQNSNNKSNVSNSQHSPYCDIPQYKGTNITGNFANSNSGNQEDFNYQRMKEDQMKQKDDKKEEISPGGTGSEIFNYGSNSNKSEDKGQYHFSIEQNNNRSEGEDEEGEGEEGDDNEEEFKYKGIEELRKEINEKNEGKKGNENEKENRKEMNIVGDGELQEDGNEYEESKYRSDEDDVNKIMKRQQEQLQFQKQQKLYQYNNNDIRSSDEEIYNKNIQKQKYQQHPRQQPKTQNKNKQYKQKQYVEDKPLSHPYNYNYNPNQPNYMPNYNQQYIPQEQLYPSQETPTPPKKQIKRFNKKYNGKLDSVALLNHYESLWKKKLSKNKKNSKSSSKVHHSKPFNSNPSPLPTSSFPSDPLVTKESKLKMHKLQFITAPLRYYYKV